MIACLEPVVDVDGSLEVHLPDEAGEGGEDAGLRRPVAVHNHSRTLHKQTMRYRLHIMLNVQEEIIR